MPIERPVAETMPLVTVSPTPIGLPIANTMSPTLIWSLSAILAAGRSCGVDLEHRDVGLRVAADDLGGQFAAVVEADEDLVGVAAVLVADDVVVGEDVAVGG